MREIAVKDTGSVRLITLNRPQRLNAYTPDMGEELVEALRGAAADTALSAVVITGAGEAFCAGADRGFLRGETSRSGKRLGEEAFIASFTEELRDLPLLTIAAFTGAAVGIGVTAMLAMDIRLASTEARFVLNFAELGIVPGLGCSFLLPRLVGDGMARQLLLSERRFDGARAAELGLVNEVLAADALVPRALSLAEAAAGCAPGMIAAIKSRLNRASGTDLAGALACERGAP
jgi:enoyl-CoA hydratase/carnithine racemase